MHAAEGILTARGGMTSHAAVVARGMGTCCVSGCNDLKVNEEGKEFELNGTVYHEGDYISLDGSTGIGLCRTEHMFFEAERIPKFRRMILSDTVEQREAALAELLPYQREDFIGMYKALRGRPMTVRFLDPPLHEFLPKTEAEMRELGDSMGLTYEEVKARCDAMHEL